MDTKELGERIRTARERLGISQEELAQRISRDQRAVSFYESGQRKIFAVDLPTLAQALQVPVTYFFTDNLTESELQIIREIESLPDAEAQQAAIEFIRLLHKVLKRHDSD